MTQMIRKQIYIPKRQQAVLKRVAKARKVSEAELIRQAIDQVQLGTTPVFHRDPEAWERALAFMKSLQAQGPVPDQRRTWKREDAYAERESRYERRLG